MDSDHVDTIRNVGLPLVTLSTFHQSEHANLLVDKFILFSLVPIGDSFLQYLNKKLSTKLTNLVVVAIHPKLQVVKLTDDDLGAMNDIIGKHQKTEFLAKLPNRTFSSPSVQSSPKRILIAHFFNEEFFLPYWIRHHARLFDSAILIDYYSTDQSVEIIRRLAPSSWRVVATRNKNWIAEDIDREVQWYENQYPSDWKIALCLTEFLVAANFKQTLQDYATASELRGHPYHKNQIYHIPTVIMFGNDSKPLVQNKPMVEQRAMYGHHNPVKITGIESVSEKLIDVCPSKSMYHRFIHRGLQDDTMQYNYGRHYIAFLDRGKIDEESYMLPLMGDAFIMKYMWSPWPDTKARRVIIEQTRVKDLSLLPNGQWNFYISLLSSNNTIEHARNLVMSGVKTFDLHDITDVSDHHDVPLNRIFQESLNIKEEV